MNFNPFETSRAMFAEFEKNLGEYLQKTMREPSFMQLVARNLEGSLDMRGVVKQQIERAVKSLNIPTESSMAGLYHTVHNLETRLLDLEEKVDELTERLARYEKPAPKAAAPAPAPAKKPAPSPAPAKKPAPKKKK